MQILRLMPIVCFALILLISTIENMDRNLKNGLYIFLVLTSFVFAILFYPIKKDSKKKKILIISVLVLTLLILIFQFLGKV